MGPVFAGAFSYALGDHKYHVRDSAEAGRLCSSAADLLQAGFRWHHVCGPSTSAYDLARAAVAPIAERAGRAQRAGRAGLDPDAIVYATCLPLNGAIDHHREWDATKDVKHLMDFPVSRLAADFGLDRAVAIGLNQQACTSMLGSLRIASALLSAEPDWNQVLCVTADRFPDGARYEQAYNLISDGAAACLVTKGIDDSQLPIEGRLCDTDAPRGGGGGGVGAREEGGTREEGGGGGGGGSGWFRIVTSHQITNGGLARASDDETVGAYFSYMNRLVREILKKADMSASDLTRVVTQNTHEKAWTILSRVAGISPERVAAPSLPDVGHVISADNVVNLTQIDVAPGDKVLLVMAGFGLNWQATILEAV